MCNPFEIAEFCVGLEFVQVQESCFTGDKNCVVKGMVLRGSSGDTSVGCDWWGQIPGISLQWATENDSKEVMSNWKYQKFWFDFDFWILDEVSYYICVSPVFDIARNLCWGVYISVLLSIKR